MTTPAELPAVFKEWLDEVYQTNSDDDQLPRDVAEFTLARLLLSQQQALLDRIDTEVSNYPLANTVDPNNQAWRVEDVEAVLSRIKGELGEGEK